MEIMYDGVMKAGGEQIRIEDVLFEEFQSGAHDGRYIVHGLELESVEFQVTDLKLRFNSYYVLLYPATIREIIENGDYFLERALLKIALQKNRKIYRLIADL